jgi:hypothetical protein
MPTSGILGALNIVGTYISEWLCSSDKLVLTRATRCNIPVNGILEDWILSTPSGGICLFLLVSTDNISP